MQLFKMEGVDQSVRDEFIRMRTEEAFKSLRERVGSNQTLDGGS